MASFVIKDVRIFTGEEVLEPGSVLVEDGIIKYVGRDTPSVDLPIITASKSTLFPGLCPRGCAHQ